MNTIKINNIIIPNKFLKSNPSKNKIQFIMEYYNKYNKLDKPIVINEENILVNNYIRYLVAKEKGLEEIPYLLEKEYEEIYPIDDTNYICGVFNKNSKEYIWKNIYNLEFNIGDLALVKSGKSKTIVTVTKVFKSNNPAYLKHKKVFKKLERKEKTNESAT